MLELSARQIQRPKCYDGRCRINVAFLAIMPSPYMRDLFEVMAADPQFDLRVYYLEMTAPIRTGAMCRCHAMPRFCRASGCGLWEGAFISILALPGEFAHNPDVVVVTGYSGITNQLVMRDLRRRRIPWIFFGEVPGLNRRGWVGTMLRNIARRPAVRWPAAIAAVGSRAVTEYRKLASASCAVENIPYCCNIEPFHQAEREPTPCGAVRFLYCGQLIRRKGVDLLLHAFIDVARSNSLATLTLVGDGPLRDELLLQIPTDLAARIRFAGFQPVEELPPWFSQADVFVLPSRHDGWGVVVNQALAAGLAIVSSDAVGAAADLVQPGVNGCVFPAGDAKNLRDALHHWRRIQPGLLKWAADPENWRIAVRRAKVSIAGSSYARELYPASDLQGSPREFASGNFRNGG